MWTIGIITNSEVREAAVTSSIEKLGSIDIVINNAGIGLYSSPSGTPPGLAERMFAVNVSAAVGLAGLVIPHMRARRSGAIINIESIGALVSLSFAAAAQTPIIVPPKGGVRPGVDRLRFCPSKETTASLASKDARICSSSIFVLPAFG